VTFRVHFLIYFADGAVGIDNEGGAFPEFHSFPFRLAEAERLHESGICVGEEVDGESELGTEIFVRSGIIGADADQFDAGGVEVGFAGGEGFALDGAAGRVVLGVEVHDEPMAGEVGEAGGFSVLIGKRKIGELIAGLGKHECWSFPRASC